MSADEILTPELIEAAERMGRQVPPLDAATRARLEGLYIRMDAEAAERRLQAALAKRLAEHEAHRDTHRGAA